MVVLAIPLLVALIGAAVYFASSNAKLAEVARIAYAAAAFALMFGAGHIMRLQ